MYVLFWYLVPGHGCEELHLQANMDLPVRVGCDEHAMTDVFPKDMPHEAPGHFDLVYLAERKLGDPYEIMLRFSDSMSVLVVDKESMAPEAVEGYFFLRYVEPLEANTFSFKYPRAEAPVRIQGRVITKISPGVRPEPDKPGWNLVRMEPEQFVMVRFGNLLMIFCPVDW